MYNAIIAKYGEIGIKGKNRYIFENKLIKNIKNILKPIGKFDVYKEYGRIYINLDDYDYEEVIEEVRKVFGIVSVSPVIKIEKDYEQLKEAALKLLEEKVDNGAKTFKVESRRGDKSFRLTSLEMNLDIGGYLLSTLGDKINVDVHKPEVRVITELRQDCAIAYTDGIAGYGGLPLGTNGKAIALLSGEIDSPVATWMVAKRGVEVEAVHFHSYPFTNEKSQEKVRDLAKILSKYCGKIRLHKVNLLNIQKEITKNCREEEMTIISRRFMMQIAQVIAEKRYANALITGESIGQVASQTIQGLTCTDAAVSIPVFRPLIAMDKSEIVDMAKKIDTYETSIIAEEDCCTVFSPKNPVTKPRLEKIVESQSRLNIEELIKEAIDNMEVEEIEY
ncbi:MAG TPA: tRNA uracil 4-sulfurtransferase ThiI [Peptostreptococcaceae bacterium]|nr:tRNA uracil 4-sulfurtransferase ThiI [Peptostreptococcaceae bacterium]